MRLTRRISKIDDLELCSVVHDEKYLRSVFVKLSNLEDIEEEYYIDFILLFKALKNGVWVNCELFPPSFIRHLCVTEDKGMIWKCEPHYLRISFFENRFSLYTSAQQDLYFKDYGITWALTKEELE